MNLIAQLINRIASNGNIILSVILIFGSIAIAQSKQPSDGRETSAEKSLSAPKNESQDINLTPPPQRVLRFKLAEIAPLQQKLVLKGINNTKKMDFSLRNDEIATNATLKLTFTPSPSLIPNESHLNVYLNNELVETVRISNNQLGVESNFDIPINPILIRASNKLELQFVGTYKAACVNLANPALWFDINKEKSVLELTAQQLPLKNDLSYLPNPFFDPNDNRPFVLPIVFPQSPNLVQQRAAGILASWFGVKAMWRQQSYPVLYGNLPMNHAIVFGTNSNMPSFLGDTKQVEQATIEIMSHPEQPYYKILLVLGRDDEDLITAVKGIAQGNLLFRGQSITVDHVNQLSPRQPYDAPRWIRIDRPVLFAELQEYQDQLDSTGNQPEIIRLNYNLPPDLFMSRGNGINMNIKYQYNAPIRLDSSQLITKLNQSFIESFPLEQKEKSSKIVPNLPAVKAILSKDQETLAIPILKPRSTNQLQFEFAFASIIGSAEEGMCQSQALVDNHGSISDQSSIDFSGYRHYIEMPNLHAFSRGGFPFSRLADLSETLVLIPENPSTSQVSTLLNMLSNISAQTGCPSINVALSDNWSTVTELEKMKDILFIGSIPPDLGQPDKINILIDEVKGFIKEPSNKNRMMATTVDQNNSQPDSKVTLSAKGPIAAIIGIQSPFNPQSSVIALLSNDAQGYNLINNAFNDPDKREAMSGSVIILRDTGMDTLRIGETYYVGRLPWWELLWQDLTDRPILLAFLCLLTVIVTIFLLWRIFRALSYRRLSENS